MTVDLPLVSRGDARAQQVLSHLHPVAIEDPAEIRALLERLRREDTPLQRGLNRRIDREVARIEAVDETGVRFSTLGFERSAREFLFLNFQLDERPHQLVARLLQSEADGRLMTALPEAIYVKERRDRSRQPGNGARVAIEGPGTLCASGALEDESPQGLGLRLEAELRDGVGSPCRVRILGGARDGEEFAGEIRHVAPRCDAEGRRRVGLEISTAPRGDLHTDVRDVIFPRSRAQRWGQQLRVAAAGARIAADRGLSRVARRRPALAKLEIRDYVDARGEPLRGIVDSWGPTRGATAVVIPPAWGRTKETLMPLAATLVASFRQAGEPVVVFRFDGIRKRGESHNDPECRAPGKDHHRFTFSQGVRDIRSTLDYLEQSEEFAPSRVILVSFSASSIEARRAVASDPRIDGWVCVVGSADLQAMMRVISGGIDFAVGYERGRRFGLQEILGVEVDMDHAGVDAVEHDLVYLEDARRDMASIGVPVTWIHGQHDAWMDADRAHDSLSRGDTRRRRFLSVPAGHMLRSSREALDTFCLIAAEAGEMALGRRIDPALPPLAGLENRRLAERARLPSPSDRTLEFWNDYLVGRDRSLGIELMMSIAPYRELMTTQVEALGLRAGDRVLDLGAGTGAFPLHLAGWDARPSPLRVVPCDFSRPGLLRACARLEERGGAPEGLVITPLECDLDVARRGTVIPLADACLDAVLGALFLGYVADPPACLREIRRVLRPGGRLVLSSLRRDADMSKLYMEGIQELKAGRARELFGIEDETRIESAARAYMNEAARLLDLEEQGVFRFWDPREFEKLISAAGFEVQSTRLSLGSPPQAVVVTAHRR